MKGEINLLNNDEELELQMEEYKLEPEKIKVEDVKLPEDSRTIEEIVLENTQMRDKLRYNMKVLSGKKRILKSEKQVNNFLMSIKFPRKVFAFKIIFPNGKGSVEAVNDACIYLKNIFGCPVTKQFCVNEYVYMKTKYNKVLSDTEYKLAKGIILVQVDPRSIFTYN